MDLERKIRNILWKDAIKSDLNKLKDYQTFWIMNSEEAIPNDYQKIP
jgi:hypothetical protein